MKQFIPGQRWISTTEPELGLGTIVKQEAFQVSILFTASGIMRTYSTENAPLQRVIFALGDSLTIHNGKKITVTAIEEQQGLITYIANQEQIPETLLADTLTFSTPLERLKHGQIDNSELFDLRTQALQINCQRDKSSVCGFVGGRIDLIAHQIYIAHEVANRYEPRVLLADEVGLGKTIEASLILQRLLQVGRISRVLILVPDSLVHQWFVELWRRFNLWFNIYNQERCNSYETDEEQNNPFLESSLIIAGMNFISKSPKLKKQIIAADWDMLVVDEAHHLHWTPQEAGTDYQMVEKLSQKITGLLLLTATPEQLGTESHFARLRLLDPHRYYDLKQFEKENNNNTKIAKIVNKLLTKKIINKTDQKILKQIFANNQELIEQHLIALEQNHSNAQQNLIRSLLDQHGIGRVMFRNTRSAMSNFPVRKANIIPLQADKVELVFTENRELITDIKQEKQFEPNYQQHPKVIWIAEFLRKNNNDKVLLICRTKQKVIALEQAIREQINAKLTIFHEDLTLIQRDRNAAWFADQEGAQILLCSEIGSEGRNFQFATHLILFDLPFDLELLEQRIGRLDRIGQKNNIQIYAPYIQNTNQEILVQWCHQGVNAFEKCIEGGFQILQKFRSKLEKIITEYPTNHNKQLKELIQKTAQYTKQLNKQLEEGRDKLLEINSYQPQIAHRLVQQISQIDTDIHFEQLMLKIFDYYGVNAEQLHNHTYLIKPDNLYSDAIPNIPEDGLNITFSRQKSLIREDLAFITREHPLAIGALDLMLSSEHGNCTLAVWKDPYNKPIFLIEMIFIIKAICTEKLHINRFLPPTPIRLLFDHELINNTKKFDQKFLQKNTINSKYDKITNNKTVINQLIPNIITVAKKTAIKIMHKTQTEALNTMQDNLSYEIERMQALKQLNPAIRQSEINLAKQQKQQLKTAITNSQITLDSIRIITYPTT